LKAFRISIYLWAPGLLAAVTPAGVSGQTSRFHIEEASIESIQVAIQRGQQSQSEADWSVAWDRRAGVENRQSQLREQEEINGESYAIT
jgi:hypothetical protein